MNPVQCVFPFEIVLAPHETEFVWYLAKKKKRASARVCLFFFFIPQCTVFLLLAKQQLTNRLTTV